VHRRLGRRLPAISWGAATVTDVLIVGIYGRRLPFSDDWTLLPRVTGAKSATLAWLWEPHNEHRIPLLKVLQLGGLRMAGYDYRIVTVLNVMACSALALFAIRTFSRLRGTPSPWDAAVPLFIMTPASLAIVWDFELPFVSTTVLYVAAMLICLRVIMAGRTQRREVGGAFVLAALLPFTGLPGVIVAPFVSAASTITALTAGWNGRRVAAWLLLPLGSISVYFVSYHAGSDPAGLDGPVAIGDRALKLLASPFGARIHYYWPLGLLLLVVSVATAVPSVRSLNHRRALALLTCAIAGSAALALAISSGRSGRSLDGGLIQHYSSLFIPLFVSVAALIPLASRGSRIFGASLLLIASATFALSTIDAVREGRDRRTVENAALAAIDGTEPARDVADRFTSALFYEDTASSRALVTEGIDLLRRNAPRASSVTSSRQPRAIAETMAHRRLPHRPHGAPVSTWSALAVLGEDRSDTGEGLRFRPRINERR
jgi:hypothetical protein